MKDVSRMDSQDAIVGEVTPTSLAMLSLDSN